MSHSTQVLAAALLIGSVVTVPANAQEREQRVRKDLENVLAGGRWLYNDLSGGLAEAQKTGKPLLVILRCIPCEACRGFDEQVAADDPRVRELLDKFVRVRIPQTNGIDLSLFQFDYDLSAFVFFLNADRTIYGRFGTRTTQEDKIGDVSIDAFREAMIAALKLHEKFSEVKESLARKTGPLPGIRTPEELPRFKGKYKASLDYKGNVVKSCIHCHQIRESERMELREAHKPIPVEILFPWPSPEVLGAQLDPRKRALVSHVDPGSATDRAGLRAGDEILSLEGQPLVSIADVQWVLHQAPDEGQITAVIRSGSEETTRKIALERGWRRRGDISWRVSTWDLRRMAAGGLKLEEATPEERKAGGIEAGALALRVQHAGEYGEHATAKNAGARKGDIIIAVDGKTARMRETDLLAYALQSKLPGDSLELTILRDGERKKVSFKLQ